MDLLYSIEVVGGPYDGAPGLKWLDDGRHPLPDVILLGRCPGNRLCGARRCPTGGHAYYWTPEEERRPVRTSRYEKQSEYVERDEEGELRGRGIYAIGGLLDPRSFGREAQEPVFAGADGPLVTARSFGPWPEDPDYRRGYEMGRQAARRLRAEGKGLSPAQLERLKDLRAAVTEWT